LAQNKLIGTTKLETLAKVFTWERDNLTHFIGGIKNLVEEDCPYYGNQNPTYGAYWGYAGQPPLSRVFNGTAMSCRILTGNGGYYDLNVRHWTLGCSGNRWF
jgi:hypothetical protein